MPGRGVRMSEERYWFEEVPEGDRFYYITEWGMPRRAEEEARQWEEKTSSETLPPGITAQDVERVDEIRRREDAVDFSSGALSPPWWPEAQFSWIHQEGPEYLRAPRIFTTKARAEAVLHAFQGDETENFMDLVDRYGFEAANEALENTSTLRVMWMDKESLLTSLEMADFLCVMVDNRLMLRQDLMEELSKE
jgi:hypothetical protein